MKNKEKTKSKKKRKLQKFPGKSDDDDVETDN